ncbi:Ser Thr kinase [Cryptosporidium bovis]|uniref:Ser Thr kinase n=1 Tax=Cryptosporidium bovis TaxID=310047 RepID=UPI00351A39CC|nr:Ser Thr kinase [Cryptosporidium bovis]
MKRFLSLVEELFWKEHKDEERLYVSNKEIEKVVTNYDLFCGSLIEEGNNIYSIENEHDRAFDVFLYSNSDAYAGEWKMSKRNGWGVFLKYTGQKFEGLWKDNERNGFGMQTIGSTIKYVGQFSNNECDGNGVIFHHSGLLYSSKWSEGELIERKLLFEGWKKDFLSFFFQINEVRSDFKMRAESIKLIEQSRKIFERLSFDKVRNDLSQIESESYVSIYDFEDRFSFSIVKKDWSGKLEEPYGKRINFINGCYSTKVKKEKIPQDLSRQIEDKEVRFFNSGNSAENCLEWNVYQLAYFIKCIGLPEYVEIFIMNELDGSTLPYISIDDLKGIGISEISHIRYLHMSFTLLLKLRLRCIRKQTFTPQRLIDDEYLKSFEIPANELNLKCRIGEGGYGKVYKAFWTTKGIMVAVKAFRRRDKSTLAREFYSELTIVSRIRHPNVTLFLGVVLSPLYCLVTELVPCGSLFDLLHIKNEILTSTQLIKISREICYGMAYLHENGVLHCDLKSSNILLSNNYDVKIGDFGLSTLMESPLETRKMLGCIGTHHWMAPEILRGEGFTKSADVYSFGTILWEMLTKKIPNEELAVNHIIASVGYGNRRPNLPKDIPSTLKVIICKTWEKNVHKRPSFKQLASIFEQLHSTSILEIEENLISFFGQ